MNFIDIYEQCFYGYYGHYKLFFCVHVFFNMEYIVN